MADNTTVNSASDPGDAIVTREISHAGDTAKLPGSFLMGVSGTEGSYTAGAIDGDATNGLDVDVTRSALPSGASTSAKQDTANTALAAIQTAVEIIDNAVSGSEFQVDVVAALPAGTNAIGKLAPNSGVDIGDVDVTSLPSTVHSADFDSGAGTDTTLCFGIAVPASGGAAVIPGDATAGLKVDLGSDNDVTVTGSVTANAGTNLNTSALALEAGGNLAGAATSLAVLDDWDETDRCKVNPIVGQAGVAAGAGAVGATVQRVTLASDDPAVADLAALEALIIGTLRGAATPSIDSYASAAISAAADTANQELVAAPGADKQIWVYGFVGTADTGDGSISIQDEDDTALSGVMPVQQNGGFAITPNGNFAMPWLKVATNKALELDTVTCGFKGVLSYAIVSI